MKVKSILESFANPPLELLTEILDLEVEPIRIDTLNWAEYYYIPKVSLQIAYNEEELFLQYKVIEQSVKAEITEVNGRVWTDSCVEFFLSPEGNQLYYNLEINCIGIPLLGYRSKGEEAFYAPNELLSKIRVHSTLGTQPFREVIEPTRWQITIAVPWEVFFMHTLKPVKGRSMRGNFYKCGDGLQVPHYISWTKINAPRPAFHVPEFFGGLEFE